MYAIFSQGKLKKVLKKVLNLAKWNGKSKNNEAYK
jgi:hypothetical protein